MIKTTIEKQMKIADEVLRMTYPARCFACKLPPPVKQTVGWLLLNSVVRQSEK